MNETLFINKPSLGSTKLLIKRNDIRMKRITAFLLFIFSAFFANTKLYAQPQFNNVTETINYLIGDWRLKYVDDFLSVDTISDDDGEHYGIYFGKINNAGDSLVFQKYNPYELMRVKIEKIIDNVYSLKNIKSNFQNVVYFMPDSIIQIYGEDVAHDGPKFRYKKPKSEASIEGRVFWDKNRDGIYNTGDFPVVNKKIVCNLVGGGVWILNYDNIYTNADGIYKIYLGNVGNGWNTLEISLIDPYHWGQEPLVTTSEDHFWAIIVKGTIITGNDFGILDNSDCINPALICNDCACFDLWDPVCGCDGKKYGNSCEARNHGVISYKSQNDIVISGPNEICKGDVATLAVSGGVNYSWNTGEQSSSISKTPQNSTFYSVEVMFPGGCKLTKSFNVNVNQPFTTTIDSLISLGDSVKVGDSFYTLPGHFKKKFSSASGCDSLLDITIRLKEFDTCYYKIYDTIHVTHHDTINITQYDTMHVTHYDTLNVTHYDTMHVTLYDTMHVTLYDTMHVTLYDTLNVTHFDTIHITHYDTLYITLIDSSYYTHIENNETISLNIYPNPAHYSLFIESPSEAISNYTLIDANGTIQRQGETNQNKINIRLEGLSKGIYFINIYTQNSKMIKRKIIVQ